VYTGSCACGAVTATIAGEPVATRQCWCRQCQKIAAGGPTNNAMFRTEHVDMRGELGSFSYTAASGNTLTWHFCARCGTAIYAQSSARPHLRTLRIGFLDEPHGLRPQMAIWTAEAPAWAVIDAAMENHAGQPPAPVRPPVEPASANRG
jgi:hypothetical protein